MISSKEFKTKTSRAHSLILSLSLLSLFSCSVAAVSLYHCCVALITDDSLTMLCNHPAFSLCVVVLELLSHSQQFEKEKRGESHQTTMERLNKCEKAVNNGPGDRHSLPVAQLARYTGTCPITMYTRSSCPVQTVCASLCCASLYCASLYCASLCCASLCCVQGTPCG